MKKLTGFGTRVFLLAGIAMLLAGCATVFTGTHENVSINSSPSGAEVWVNGYSSGTTPVTLKLESKKTYHIEFRKEGYDPKTYTLTNHIMGGYVILDVISGLVPVVVDAFTGAWYKLDQENVNIILEQQQGDN